MSFRETTQTGTYSGTGSSQTVTLGWRPELVVVTSDRTSGSSANHATSFCRFDSNFIYLAREPLSSASGGLSFTATGFTVGTSDLINRSGDDYYWTAFKETGLTELDTFLGTPVDFGLQPEVAFVLEGGVGYWMKTEDQSGSNCVTYKSAGCADSTEVAYNSTGLTLSGDADNAGTAYGFVSGANPPFITGSYTGNGTSQTITVGQTPLAVFVLSNTDGGFKNDAMPSGAWGRIDTEHDWLTSGFNIVTDGFQLTTADCNANTVTYYYIAAVA